MYKKMMEDAKAKGYTSEKAMWDSVDSVEDMLCIMKKEHPDKYWKFIRRQHGIIYNGHYSEDFAKHDVDHLMYTNKNGERKEGGYWSVDEVEDATKKYSFPSGVNKWDKYVAFNAMRADMCKKFDDAQVLDMAYLFYFADEDWGDNTKIWDYMCCAYNK